MHSAFAEGVEHFLSYAGAPNVELLKKRLNASVAIPCLVLALETASEKNGQQTLMLMGMLGGVEQKVAILSLSARRYHCEVCCWNLIFYFTRHQLFSTSNQFGVHQNLPDEDDEHYAETKAVINASIEYMKQIWSGNEDNNRVNYKCRNMHEDCSLWAINECEDQDDVENAEYVRSNCAPACRTCHLLDSRLRCPIEEGNELVLGPGGLNALFERIADNADGKGEYLKYNPRVLSRPETKADGTPAPGVGNLYDVKDGPWVVVLENFVSDTEADALIAAGHKTGYTRSADVGVENPDGTHEDDVSDGRTSHNSWCDEELCDNDPVIGPVVKRIATVTGTTVGHSEALQLLRYEPGQYYNR